MRSGLEVDEERDMGGSQGIGDPLHASWAVCESGAVGGGVARSLGDFGGIFL